MGELLSIISLLGLGVVLKCLGTGVWVYTNPWKEDSEAH